MATELIDASKLDACCTAEANAIRAKTGGSSPITFDWSNSKGFADAIAAIPAGGGYSLEDIFVSQKPDGVISFNPSAKIPGYGISGRTMTALTLDLTDISGLPLTRDSITQCKMETITLIYPTSGTAQHVENYTISACGELLTIVIRGDILQLDSNALRGNGKLKTVDITNITVGNSYAIGQNVFYGTKLDTLILRQSSVVGLLNINAFTNSTEFRNGGAGGTIYIPKTLYDHLGDGSSLDYKADTNWATIDGYGTITWAKIEGGYYETHYADGTLVS